MFVVSVSLAMAASQYLPAIAGPDLYAQAESACHTVKEGGSPLSLSVSLSCIYLIATFGLGHHCWLANSPPEQ